MHTVLVAFLVAQAPAHAAGLPDGLTPVRVADVLASPAPFLEGCTAGMAQRGRTVSRWVGCGDRTLSVIGSVPQLEVDVASMLEALPTSLGETLGETVRGEPTAMNHAGAPVQALRLTTVQEGVRIDLGLAVAWKEGVMRELGICLGGSDRRWCEDGLRALLTPRRTRGPSDSLGGQEMTLVLEPAPEGSSADGILLRPVPPPTGASMIGCQRFSGMDDPGVQRLDCTQGRVVVQPVPTPTDPDAARQALLPYLSTPETPLVADGPAAVLRIGPRDLLAAPIAGDGVRGIVVTDPTAPSPRALGCLDRAPGIGATPWCTVALQNMWGPGTADGPRPE